MSTPVPDPELAFTEEKPFDPHDFPQDLRTAQLRAAGLYAEIHARQARLPWSREPHPGWPETKERGRESSGRAASPGWDPADAAAYDELWADLRKATAAIQGHQWWEICRAKGVNGPALVAARQALKSQSSGSSSAILVSSSTRDRS
ncbi:hypothetical protein [Streptomyces sp. NPDC056672]|uniref:hypothetical protein n=1 Tax=Streptomyces sp. NPDC056672 TaxID=3345906 RepID=UPI0036CED699